MSKLILPPGYRSSLDLLQTQKYIKEIKDFFQVALAKNLDLTRVSAPMFVKRSTGINDYLTGVEKPVSFQINEESGLVSTVEVVHSLAKWKRFALKKYNIPVGHGLYTDMNAIRSFEDLDNYHSVYVDQWDWEKVIREEDRTIDYLKETVRSIYKALLDLDDYLASKIEGHQKLLVPEVFFITSQDLEDMYPDLTPEQREERITKEHRSVFIIGIGEKLKSGIRHGDRSPDYDDWQLNGDLIVWNPVLGSALELSSMGIRVSPKSLHEQLQKTNTLDRLQMEYHSLLMSNQLPYTIGGGIGQSRICMFFLQKAHIGEVQASVWSENMLRACERNGIVLL